MGTCPACGQEVPESASECPVCRLSTSLFAAVREAAGPEGSGDPVYMQTVGELLRSVDLSSPPAPAETGPGLLDRSHPHRRPTAAPDRPLREPETLHPLDQLPTLPPPGSGSELRHQVEEYGQLARRIGVDVGPVASRVSPALLANDEPSLGVIARELFVRAASALAEEYEAELVRRNEIAHLVPTPSADVELDAVRRSIGVGDLVGAQRRLEHVRDELSRLEEEWAAGRILATECDLLAETLRELGGDPAGALGPLEQGRRNLGTGHREAAERLLARAAVALWSLLQPRFFEELKRLRDRLVSVKAGGVDIAPAVSELRSVAAELKARNFAGAVSAYRQLKGFLERAEPPAGDGTAESVVDPTRPFPSA